MLLSLVWATSSATPKITVTPSVSWAASSASAAQNWLASPPPKAISSATLWAWKMASSWAWLSTRKTKATAATTASSTGSGNWWMSLTWFTCWRRWYRNWRLVTGDWRLGERHEWHEFTRKLSFLLIRAIREIRGKRQSQGLISPSR